MSEEEINGDTSDGYHTFNELYEHRCLLYLTWLFESNRQVLWVAEHYKGWDLVASNVGMNQISYHIPMKYRKFLEARYPQGKRDSLESVYDGHTSHDVIQRLLNNLNTY